jgi:serine/threonine protein kinase
MREGDVIAGRYRLERLLGKGGMGFVWAATHLVTRRWVAVKVLGPLGERPDMRRRFVREARAAAAVEHPNVIDIYDVFEIDDGTPVMVMALLRGETLDSRLDAEGSLSLEATLRILLPVVSAVGTAHARGVVHRDLKPENVFLAREDGREVVKVLDFGIAKVAGDEALDAGTITSPGTMLGTPCYMAPEQAFGERDIDHRADLWSIGVLLYETLTGERPVEGENLGQVLKRILSQGMPSIAERLPDLPAPIADLVSRLLSYDRQQRPADLREVHEVLSRFTPLQVPAFDAPSQRPVRDSDIGPTGRHPDEARTLYLTPADPLGMGTRDLKVDPVAPTEHVAPDTPSAHSLSIVNGSTPRRALLFSGVGLVLVAGVLVWQLGPRRERATDLALESATPAHVIDQEPAPVSRDAQAHAAHPEPTYREAAGAVMVKDVPLVAPAASADAGSARPPTPRELERFRQAQKRAQSRARPATKPAPAPSSAPAASAPAAQTPPQPASEGLHEEPPF